MTRPFSIPSQTARIAVVTGANSGIGLWTAFGLARAGARVVMVCRNKERGERAVEFVAKAGTRPDLVLVDFSSLKAVRDAGAHIAHNYPQLHILVNNAGLFSLNRELTRDGYETTFAVNHLAPFLLTNTLLPALERGGESGRHARIVTVASAASQRASIDMTDLMSERRYGRFAAYGQSKLANIFFTKELARRLPPWPVSANCLHPGVVATAIGNKGGIAGLVWTALKLLLISPEQGASNSLFVAASPSIEGVSGVYFVKERPATANPVADDPALASALWSRSETLVDAALSRADP
jgi:NAD(P)-dependent dehydrogenase (short-subunit alcohol dehydrogenase family)